MIEFSGHIVALGFASGDRVLCGMWDKSPFGTFTDVMWQQKNDHRILISPWKQSATFISSHYSFDEVRVGPVTAAPTKQGFAIVAGPLNVEIHIGPPTALSRLIRLRPNRLLRNLNYLRFEDRFIRPIVNKFVDLNNARSYGLTQQGTQQWYAIHDILFLSGAYARREGIDLGEMVECRHCKFGHSSPPPRPSVIAVSTYFDLLKP